MDSDPEQKEIITELSEEERLKLKVLETLREPCDRKTYGKRLDAAAEQLGCSRRTIQRLVRQWEQEGLAAVRKSTRADQAQHRIEPDLVDWIIKTYKEGNKSSTRLTRAQVAIRVKAKAAELGIQAPSHMTVYRILASIVEEQKQSKTLRNPGWRGTKLALATKDGTVLEPHHSNHVWQCDHTIADIMLVDQYGEVLGRPCLTIIVDSYSRCIMGMNLGFDKPSSLVMALALRQAILPKRYGSNYGLKCEWGTYGKPEYFFTDSGTDFKSHHAQHIAAQLGFSWHFRARPSEGGIVERIFKTLNNEVFSNLHGYTGSNVNSRPEDAEKDACLTLQDLHLLLVRYIADNYNQTLDARMGDQTRYERWDAGLPMIPDPISEQDLHICLMKQTRRTVYQGGHLQFNNLTYKGENLGSYAGESVVMRYDPTDITTIFIFKRGCQGV